MLSFNDNSDNVIRKSSVQTITSMHFVSSYCQYPNTRVDFNCNTF